MKSKIDELADRVNEVLTPREVLEAIGYRTEGIQEKGETVRCYCPIHKDTLLRSMTVDANKRAFKCMYAGCAGRNGGTYLSLYRLATGTDLEEALVVLAQVAGIDVKAFAQESAPVVVREEKRATQKEGQTARMEPTDSAVKTKAVSLEEALVEGKPAKAKVKKPAPKAGIQADEPPSAVTDSQVEIEPLPLDEVPVAGETAEPEVPRPAPKTSAQADELSPGTKVERSKPAQKGSKDPERVSKRTSFL